MGLRTSWEAANYAATQEISQHFMKPEGSLRCSQEPSGGLYPEPDQSNPYYPILSLYDMEYVIIRNTDGFLRVV
jgi:hypothetical protein